MTAQSRDAHIPAYLAAETALAEATRKLHEARELREHIRDQLVAASREEAKHQIGAVLKLPRGEFKVTRLCPHWLNATVIYPVMVQKRGKNWGKREHHGYDMSYNFELDHWEYGTVTAEDGFRPRTKPLMIKAEIESAEAANG